MKNLMNVRLLLIAILFPQSAWSAEYASEQDYFAELPVVLSASRLSQPLSEAPNAMTVIDRAMIKASGFRTISKVFRLVPGMYVGYVDGHTPIVAYHGSTLREPLFQPILQGVADACSTMVPWNSGSILLTQQMPHDVLLSAGYYYQEELKFIDTPAPLSIMRRLDLRIAQTFGKPDASGGEVALVVQNAFQDSYNEYGAVTQTAGTIFFGRRALLAGTLRF